MGRRDEVLMNLVRRNITFYEIDYESMFYGSSSVVHWNKMLDFLIGPHDVFSAEQISAATDYTATSGGADERPKMVLNFDELREHLSSTTYRHLLQQKEDKQRAR